MGDETFNDCIFNTFNMPPLHTINYDGLMSEWKKSGEQRMGTLKGDDATAGPSSAVVQLHRSAEAVSPLYST